MIDVLSSLNLKCTIERPIQSVEASGAPTEAFFGTAYNVPFAFYQLSASEARRFDREAPTKSVGLRFLPDTGIDERDRVVFGTRRFHVESVNAVYSDQTGLKDRLDVVAEEVT